MVLQADVQSLALDVDRLSLLYCPLFSSARMCKSYEFMGVSQNKGSSRLIWLYHLRVLPLKYGACVPICPHFMPKGGYLSSYIDLRSQCDSLVIQCRLDQRDFDGDYQSWEMGGKAVVLK